MSFQNKRLRNFKNISLRIRIFLAMILLVLMASILIVAVTICQYDEETKEYNIERFGRKEAATKVRISQLLKKANFKGSSGGLR